MQFIYDNIEIHSSHKDIKNGLYLKVTGLRYCIFDESSL